MSRINIDPTDRLTDSRSDLNDNFTELYEGKNFNDAPEKTTPVSNDLVCILDSQDSNKVKKVKRSNIAPPVNNASTTARGIIEIATKAEAEAGTDTSRAVTPEGAKAVAENEVNNQTGWEKKTTVIPTRASADDPTYVLTFAGVDLTSKVSLGMKIKWTQNSTVRYGFVTAISFSTNTTLTLYGGTDYDVEDTSTHAISDVYFSHHKAPLSFPLNPDKWSVELFSSSRYSYNNLPTSYVHYNTNAKIALPIGEWETLIAGDAQCKDNNAGWYGMSVVLAESTDGTNPISRLSAVRIQGGNEYARSSFFKKCIITRTSAIILYLVGRAEGPGNLDESSIDSCNIKATITYL